MPGSKTSTSSSSSGSASTSAKSSPKTKKSMAKLKNRNSSESELNSINNLQPINSIDIQQDMQTYPQNPLFLNDPGSPTSTREQKFFVGLNAKSIKCIWDQYDQSETEISAEVFPILAEDASYRLWELTNSLKTFTQHSGGKLSTDTVSDVLKDCNVPPVIGARSASTEWNRIDYDGTYYYHDDKIINLREEYLKEITTVQSGPLELDCNWLSKEANLEDLKELVDSIMLAVILGDNLAYNYTIHTVLINPFIGCILPSLMQKSLEFLSFEYTEECLERLLPFLKCIAYNFHTRDVTNIEINFHLCNVFMCLLLGSIDIASNMVYVRTYQKRNELLIKAEPVDEMDTDEVQNNDWNNEVEEEMAPKFVINPVAIKQELKSNDFEYIRKKIKVETDFYDTDFQDYDPNKVIKPEPTSYPDDTENLYEDFQIDYPNEIYSPFETNMCEDRFVDEVCAVIGHLASQWGYVEHEMIFLLSRRLEIFFYSITSWSMAEFKWLSRCAQVLISLGDAAFRELTQYFEYTPTYNFPEWLQPLFNYATIFIRGRGDYYLYEYMQEICGDGMVPFQLYYSKAIEKIQRKFIRRQKRHNEKETPLQVSAKIILATSPKIKPEKEIEQKLDMDTLFPDRQTQSTSRNKKIGFRFAGCRPVPVKPKLKSTVTQEIVQAEESLRKFNEKIVICKRKLLKPMYFNDYVDEKDRNSLVTDYRWLTI